MAAAQQHGATSVPVTAAEAAVTAAEDDDGAAAQQHGATSVLVTAAEAAVTAAEDDVWCFCRRGAAAFSGGMIECESGASCPTGQWFHFECVGIVSEQQTSQTWYCECCQPASLRPPPPPPFPPPIPSTLPGTKRKYESGMYHGGSAGRGDDYGMGHTSVGWSYQAPHPHVGVGVGVEDGVGVGVGVGASPASPGKRQKKMKRKKKSVIVCASAADIDAIVSSQGLEALDPAYAASFAQFLLCQLRAQCGRVLHLGEQFDEELRRIDPVHNGMW